MRFSNTMGTDFIGALSRETSEKLVKIIHWSSSFHSSQKDYKKNFRSFLVLHIRIKMQYPSNGKDSSDMEKSGSGPTVVLLWVWNWFATLPKTVTNMFANFKNGEFISKFSMLDAMMQFLFAVATSCHPQEDGFDGEEVKSEKSTPTKAAKSEDLKVFGGPGRTLRPRTVSAES